MAILDKEEAILDTHVGLTHIVTYQIGTLCQLLTYIEKLMHYWGGPGSPGGGPLS